MTEVSVSRSASPKSLLRVRVWCYIRGLRGQRSLFDPPCPAHPIPHVASKSFNKSHGKIRAPTTVSPRTRRYHLRERVLLIFASSTHRLCVRSNERTKGLVISVYPPYVRLQYTSARRPIIFTRYLWLCVQLGRFHSQHTL